MMALAAVTAALAACVFGLAISNVKLWIELRAMQKSTHQVQYVNMGKQEFQAFNDELKEKLAKEFFDNIN